MARNEEGREGCDQLYAHKGIAEFFCQGDSPLLNLLFSSPKRGVPLDFAGDAGLQQNSSVQPWRQPLGVILEAVAEEDV